jgi:hypothetical protein
VPETQPLGESAHALSTIFGRRDFGERHSGRLVLAPVVVGEPPVVAHLPLLEVREHFFELAPCMSELRWAGAFAYQLDIPPPVRACHV